LLPPSFGNGIADAVEAGADGRFITKARLLQMPDQALGCDPGHHLICLVHAPPAVVAERKR